MQPNRGWSEAIDPMLRDVRTDMRGHDYGQPCGRLRPGRSLGRLSSGLRPMARLRLFVLDLVRVPVQDDDVADVGHYS